MTIPLNNKKIRYALSFGLTISIAKGLLTILQGRPEALFQEMALYFVISTIIALPLYIYKQERQRHGIVMDQIILLTIGLVVTGGMIHDQVALRVSKLYFTIGHTPIWGIQSETLLAIIWGFLGTWWLGAALGIILALVACGGERPHFPIRQIIRLSIFPLLAIEAISWLMAVVGYYLTRQGYIGLEISGYANILPKAEHATFMADWWANGTAYSLVSLGCIVLCHHIGQARASQALNTCDKTQT